MIGRRQHFQHALAQLLRDRSVGFHRQLDVELATRGFADIQKRQLRAERLRQVGGIDCGRSRRLGKSDGTRIRFSDHGKPSAVEDGKVACRGGATRFRRKCLYFARDSIVDLPVPRQQPNFLNVLRKNPRYGGRDVRPDETECGRCGNLRTRSGSGAVTSCAKGLWGLERTAVEGGLRQVGRAMRSHENDAALRRRLMMRGSVRSSNREAGSRAMRHRALPRRS